MFWKQQSYDELPGLSVRRHQLRRHLRTVTIAWLFGTIWLVSISGPQSALFFRMLGFGDLEFGILTAIPFIASGAQVLSAILMERSAGLSKYNFLFFGAISRYFWLVLAFLPLVLPVNPLAAAVLALTLRLCSALCGQFSAPPWLTWMGRLVPSRIRGRYFAFRNSASMIVSVIASLFIAYALDALGLKGDLEYGDFADYQRYFLSGLLGVGAIFGIVDVLMFKFIPEVLPTIPPSREFEHLHGKGLLTLRAYLIEPLRDHDFRSCVFYGVCITAASTVSLAYFMLNIQKNLLLDNTLISISFQIIPTAATFVALQFVGKLIDRWGRKPILMICTIGAIFSPLLWLFLTKDTVGLFLYSCIPGFIGGFMWAGINEARMNIVFRFADGDGQSRYVAVFNFACSLGGAFGGILGGVVTASLAWMDYQSPLILGPFQWNNWHVAMLLSVAFRALALVYLFRMHDPGAYPTWTMIRQVRSSVANFLNAGIYAPLRAFGWRRPKDDDTSA